MGITFGLNAAKDLLIVGLGSLVIWQGVSRREPEELRIGGANGNSILLSAKGKTPQITMTSNGAKILSAGIFSNGSPYLLLQSNQNRGSVFLEASKNGSGVIITDSKSGRKRIMLGSLFDFPGLVILDNKGVSTATLPAAKKK